MALRNAPIHRLASLLPLEGVPTPPQTPLVYGILIPYTYSKPLWPKTIFHILQLNPMLGKYYFQTRPP